MARASAVRSTTEPSTSVLIPCDETFAYSRSVARDTSATARTSTLSLVMAAISGLRSLLVRADAAKAAARMRESA